MLTQKGLTYLLSEYVCDSPEQVKTPFYEPLLPRQQAVRDRLLMEERIHDKALVDQGIFQRGKQLIEKLAHSRFKRRYK